MKPYILIIEVNYRNLLSKMTLKDYRFLIVDIVNTKGEESKEP